MTTLMWLDPDGYHLWVSHMCKGKQETTMLPFPAWHLDDKGRIADGCSVYCNPMIGGCGLHVPPGIPITFVPKSSAANSPRKPGWLQRTLRAWRRKP